MMRVAPFYIIQELLKVVVILMGTTIATINNILESISHKVESVAI